MAESRLEGDARPRDHRRATRVRGRDGDQHLLTPTLGLVAQRRKGTLCSVPRNRGPNTTLLASMTAEGMGPCLAVWRAWLAGSSSRHTSRKLSSRVFGAGRFVVMDNLSAHKGERIRELIESTGCKLLYLPPYSPDFNPIEEAFSKVKGLLRKAQARSRKGLVESIGKALDTVTARDARGFLEHCGYRALGQPF
jgi:transposase